MGRLLHPTATGRAGVLAGALALYTAVFAVRLMSPDAVNGLAFLYVLPIVMIAIEFGVVASLFAAAGGLGLVGAWDALTSQGIGLLGYATRGLAFFTVASLCAQMAERARRESEVGDRYFELGNDLLCTANLEGYFVRVNDRWREVFGWSTDELLARPFLEFVHPDDRERTVAETAQIVGRDGATASFANRFAVNGGGWRRIEWSSTLDLEQGLIYAAARDVTERHDLEEARREAEERFRVAFEDSATGMAVVALTEEHSGQIVEANEEMATILGVPRDKILGLSGIMDFAHEDDAERVRLEMAGLAGGARPVVCTEMRILRPDGHAHWVHITSSLLHDGDGRPLFRLSQIMDIDARKRADEQLRHMADHDPLSWLFNRRRFVDELTSELTASQRQGSRGAVLVIDLDGFKQVNDRAGHAAGDEVIKTVSLALIRRLRSGDAAGRMGGDEFGILLRRVTPEDAILVSHDLLEAVADALGHLEHEVARRVTLSIGIAVIDGSEASPDALLERADAAMYQAKRDGGGRVALSASVLAGV